MVRNHAWVLLLGGGFVFASGFWGCSDDETTAAAGPTAGPGGSMAGPATGTGTGTSTSTGMTMTSDIGIACTTDDDCRAKDMALRCLKATDNSMVIGGGAPLGYCTKDCSGDSDCPADAACVTNGGAGECYLECTLGPQWMFIDDPVPMTKCHGRVDTMCRNATVNGAQVPVCLPVCGSDSQCGGRVCDPRTALCQDTAHTGRPTGQLCDPDAADEDGCAGHCQTFTGTAPNPDFSICSQLCSLGGQPFDGQPDCGGFPDMCVYKATNSGAGDWGACNPNCTAHDTCGNPSMFCVTTSYAPEGSGYCYGTDACPNGQGDCVDTSPNPDYEYTCTQTPGGPFCLETDTMNGNQLVYPLGMGTGGAGGAGGGTTSAGGSGGVGGAGGN